MTKHETIERLEKYISYLESLGSIEITEDEEKDLKAFKTAVKYLKSDINSDAYFAPAEVVDEN